MRRITVSVLLLAAAALLLPVAGARAATITIINSDGPGEGFNDPTPVAPIGGNPGTTIGAQRLNVFQRAADIWGALLPSDVTIEVESSFDALTCDASSAVLGSAGPETVQRDFPGALLAGTWYHAALANKLAGTDLDPGTADIRARFNSSIDNNDNCLAGTNWYYGLDGNEGSDVELLPVVLHELGHGLGFSTLVDGSTGSEFMGYRDAFEHMIRDDSVNMTWDQMTDSGRAASAVRTGELAFDGVETTNSAQSYLDHMPEVKILSPTGLAGTVFDVGTAAFGPTVIDNPVSGEVVLVDDGTGTTSDGCDPIITDLTGKIALIDRGTCTFASKVKNAQDQGAIGVIVVNNVSGAPITMGGSDATITIPALMISLTDGNTIKANLPGVAASMQTDPVLLAGADPAGRVLLYAPDPLEPGSSISHFDVSCYPDLLMEPAINTSLSSSVDLTLPAFIDLGWLTGATAVGDNATPFAARIDGNYPNPFNPSTRISFTLARGAHVLLQVFDTRGRLVRTLEDATMSAGDHTVTWDGLDSAGRRAASGTYACRLAAGDVRQTRMMTLVK